MIFESFYNLNVAYFKIMVEHASFKSIHSKVFHFYLLEYSILWMDQFGLRDIALAKIMELVHLEDVHKLFSEANKLIIFTNPSARAGYDTSSVFKRNLTGLNSKFSFS